MTALNWLTWMAIQAVLILSMGITLMMWQWWALTLLIGFYGVVSFLQGRTYNG